MEFIRASGIAKSRVYKALKGVQSLDLICQVVSMYPDVDARWLLTGVRGESMQSRTGDSLLSRVEHLVAEHGPTARLAIGSYLDGLAAGLGQSTATGSVPERLQVPPIKRGRDGG